jgi:hypothetical protein
MSASSPMHSWPFDGKVSNEWFDRGAWLFQAAEIFADEYQITQFRQHAERFAELRDGERPEIFEQSTNLSGSARKKELLNRLIFDEEKDAFRLYLAFKELLQMTLKNKLYSGWSPTAREARLMRTSFGFRREHGSICTCTSTRGTSSEGKGRSIFTSASSTLGMQ